MCNGVTLNVKFRACKPSEGNEQIERYEFAEQCEENNHDKEIQTKDTVRIVSINFFVELCTGCYYNHLSAEARRSAMSPRPNGKRRLMMCPARSLCHGLHCLKARNYALQSIQMAPVTRHTISKQALQYVKDHRKELIAEFTKGYRESHPEVPLSIFLAGSPGAGKTEYAQSIVDLGSALLRIEADAVREWLPMYTGSNSDSVQQAASRGVDFLYDYALKQEISIMLDSTFTPFAIARQNVQRSLKRGRIVQLHYIYQDPLAAWAFVKKREIVEGRRVPRDAFIRKFFEAYENVGKIKREFGEQVELTVVVRDYRSQEKQFFAVAPSLESIIKIPYTERQLRKILPR